MSAGRKALEAQEEAGHPHTGTMASVSRGVGRGGEAAVTSLSLSAFTGAPNK